MSGDRELTVVRDENGELTRECAAALEVEADQLLADSDVTDRPRCPDNVPLAPMAFPVPQSDVTVRACLGRPVTLTGALRDVSCLRASKPPRVA